MKKLIIFFTRSLPASTKYFKTNCTSHLSAVIFCIALCAVLGAATAFFPGCRLEQGSTGSLALNIGTSGSGEVSSFDIGLKGPGGQEKSASADQDGIVVIDELETGSWTVTVNALNASNVSIGSKTGTVEIPEDKVVTFEMTVAINQPGPDPVVTGSLALYITTSGSNVAVSSYRITLNGPGSQVKNATAGSNGTTTVNDLSEGSWSVNVTALGANNASLGSKSDTVTVIANQTVSRNITIAISQPNPAGSLALNITASGGTVSTYRITLNGPNSQVKNATAGSNGSVTVNDLTAGSWSVAVTALNANNVSIGSKTDTVTVVANQTVTRNITITITNPDPGTTLLGWQLNETNTGLKGDYSSLTEFNLNGADAGKGRMESGNLVLNAGVTVSNRIITTQCNFRNSGVTLDHCLIRPRSVGAGLPIVTGSNITILDSEIDGEQCSWVHDDELAATEKAKALIRAAVERVKQNEPLENRSVPMSPATLVLGGGIAGMTSALELADAGQPVYLVESTNALGGNVARVDLTAPYLDSGRDLLLELITRVTKHPNISVMLKSELLRMGGFIGNFTCKVKDEDGREKDLPIGSVIVCTGYKEFDASRIKSYGYGTFPDVITSFELESMIRKGKILKKDGTVPQFVSLIHCVGSRSEEFHPYCSRACCMTALKYAHEIKSAIPTAYVSDLYIDMHAFGKGCEDFYRKSAEVKTMFLMYKKNFAPQVRLAEPNDDFGMLITVQEQLSGEEIEIPADLIVLMVGMEPREDSEDVAHLVNISRDKDGWFIESHPKLDPVATTTDGVFIAGVCSSPKDIPDSVAQARAASARVLSRISQGVIWTDAVYAEINEDYCSGCRICNNLCPYTAIEFDEKKKRSRVIDAVCKACGACVAACPSGAIKARHFTDEQIFAQIEGVL